MISWTSGRNGHWVEDPILFQSFCELSTLNLFEITVGL